MPESPHPPATGPRHPWTWYDVAVVAACGGWYLSYWNRHLSPCTGAGGELFVAEEFTAGRIPYRDYFFLGLPAYVLWTIGVTAVAGPKLIVIWFLAMVERVLAMAALNRWLLRLGPPWAAALATVTVCVAASGDSPDSMGFGNFHTFLLATFAGYFLSKRWESPSGRGRVWLAAGGAALGAGLLLKQTSGLIVTVGAGSAFLYATMLTHGFRRAAGDAVGLTVVTLAPFALVIGWLWNAGALDAFIDQVYVNGPTSKGGLLFTLGRPVRMALTTPPLGLAAVSGTMLVAWVAALAVTGRSPRPAARLIAAVATVLTVLWAVAGIRLTGGAAWFAALACVYAGLFGSAWVTGWAVVQSVSGDRSPAVMYRGMGGAVGLSIAAAMSLSWPAFEPMLIPGFAVCLVLTLGLRLPPDIKRVVLAAAVALCVYLIGTTAVGKWTAPNTWGFWVEPPVWTASAEPLAPGLAGFRLAPETARFYDTIYVTARDHTGPDDRVFAHPHMPIVYGVTGRRPATFGLFHWIDACPDDLARADAARILASPPKMIVHMDLTDDAMRDQEVVFRAGNESGQRELRAAVRSLLPQYTEVAAFGPPVARCPVSVWLRKDPAPSNE